MGLSGGDMVQEDIDVDAKLALEDAVVTVSLSCTWVFWSKKSLGR